MFEEIRLEIEKGISSSLGDDYVVEISIDVNDTDCSDVVIIQITSNILTEDDMFTKSIGIKCKTYRLNKTSVIKFLLNIKIRREIALLIDRTV